MTGYRVMILRDGYWQSVEIEQLTDAELDDLERREPHAGWIWAKALAGWIRDHVLDEDSAAHLADEAILEDADEDDRGR